MIEKMKTANFNQNPRGWKPDQQPGQPETFNRAPRTAGIDSTTARAGMRSHDRGYYPNTLDPAGLLSPRTVPIPIAALKLASRGTG